MNGAVSYPGRPLLRRGDYGDRCFDLCRLAPRQRRSRGQVDRPPVRCPGGGLSLPATARPPRLLPPLAQPLPPPRSDRPQGGPDRPPARRQSLRRLCPAGALLQGGRPGRPPAPRRPRSWQAPAALRRRHRPVPRRAPRGDPLRPARLHPPRLGRVRLAYGLAPLPQEVRPGSSQPRRGVAHARRGCSRGPCDRADRRARPGRRAAHRGRASAATASGIFFAPTQYAGAFLLLPRALDWLAVARDCFADDYGSLACGLLTSVFAPVIGLSASSTWTRWRTGASPCSAAAAPAPRGTPSAAGGGTCAGTRSMPSAGGLRLGSGSAATTPWSVSTSTPCRAGRASTPSARAT